MIPKKTTKMIVKDGNGDYLQLLPEAYTDSALNASSSDPISNAAATSALNATADKVAELNLFKVMENEPTSLNTEGTADKAIFAWLQPETWTITVDTEATTAGNRKAAIPFNLAAQTDQTNAVLNVDWGDGTTSTLSKLNYTITNTNASIHEYENPGKYTITISSMDWNEVYFLTFLGAQQVETDPTEADSAMTGAIYYFRRTLQGQVA